MLTLQKYCKWTHFVLQVACTYVCSIHTHTHVHTHMQFTIDTWLIIWFRACHHCSWIWPKASSLGFVVKVAPVQVFIQILWFSCTPCSFIHPSVTDYILSAVDSIIKWHTVKEHYWLPVSPSSIDKMKSMHGKWLEVLPLVWVKLICERNGCHRNNVELCCIIVW